MKGWLRETRSRFGALSVLALNLWIFGDPVLTAATNPPDTPERVVVREVELVDAIRRLSADANLDLVFADDLVKDVRLLLDPGQRLTVDDLDDLLEGTDFGWKVSQSNRLIFFKDLSKPARKVSGFVIAARGGGAIVNAKVSLLNTKRVTRTDATGAFRFHGVPEKFDQVVVEAENFASCQINLADMGNKDLLVILEQPFQVSEKLRVFSPKRTHLSISPLTGKLSFTDSETFQEGTPGWDLFDSLKEIPGISTGRNEAGLEFRGGQPSENLVLLDGIPLFQFDHVLGTFSALNADAIGEIEVFKSGYPANYGDRLAGVVNLTTREDVFDKRELRAGLDRDKADITYQSPLGDHLAVLVSGRSSVGEDISNSTYERRFETTFNDDEPLVEEGNGLTNFREIKFSDFIGKVAWRPGALHRINLTVFNGEDEVVEGINYDLLQSDYYKKEGVLTNEGVSLFWGSVWSASFDTEVRITNSKNETEYNVRLIAWDLLEFANNAPERPLPYEYTRQLDAIEDRTFEFEGHWLVHSDHQLDFGITSSKKTFLSEDSNTYLEDQVREFGTELNSLYLQDHWQITPKLSGLFGLRTVDNELTDTSFLEPRFSFQYLPMENWSLRGSWGKYHQHLLRSPDSVNYFNAYTTWFLARDELKPGESQHFQLGTGWTHGGWSLDFEMYRRLQRGGLLRRLDPIRRRFLTRQSRDRVEGFDFLLRKSKGQFSSFIGYSYQKAKVLEDEALGIPYAYDTDRSQPHQLNLALNYSRGVWRTVLAWRYATGVPYSTPLIGVVNTTDGTPFVSLIPPAALNDRRVPDSHQLDARIQYSFGGNRFSGNLGLYLFNVYDRSNILYRYYTLDSQFAIQNELDRERLEDIETIPVDVPGFGFRPSLRLQIVF